MKHNKKKLLIILDELMMLFLRFGCTGITVNFDIVDGQCSICIRGKYEPTFRKEIEKLEELLSAGRNIETEEYYWSISGCAELNQGSELYVVGSMLDHCSVLFDEEYLEILAYRKI